MPIKVNMAEYMMYRLLELRYNNLLKAINENKIIKDQEITFQALVLARVKFWRDIKAAYGLDEQMNYRIDAEGFLEVERGRELWHRLEIV